MAHRGHSREDLLLVAWLGHSNLHQLISGEALKEVCHVVARSFKQTNIVHQLVASEPVTDGNGLCEVLRLRERKREYGEVSAYCNVGHSTQYSFLMGLLVQTPQQLATGLCTHATLAW